MSFRTNHRQPLPQPCAEAGARAWLQTMQRSGKLIGEQLSAVVDTRASDPGGGVVS